MYEGSVCVCCMSTENLEDLFLDNNSIKAKTNYANLLKSCLNIKISESDGHDSICEKCCKNLIASVKFKRQALKSIAILSSVDLTDLINDEDLENLGLVEGQKREESQSYNATEKITDKNHDHETLSVNNELKESKDELNEKKLSANEVKTKDKIKKRERKVSTLHKTSVESKSKIKTKPYKDEASKSKMPYKVAKDELKCRECSMEFASNHTLRIHYNDHFGIFKCKACNKGFMKRESLRQHSQAHLSGSFSCDQCGKSFASIHTLKTHKLRHHDGRLQYKCDLCPSRFNTTWKREKHRQDEHGNTEARFKCNYCEERFMDGVKLSNHISNVHKLKLFPCPVCGVKFKPANLRLHMLGMHAIGKGFKCPLPSCGAMHAYRSSLQKHLRSHFDDRRYVCKLCSRAFIQKCALRKHTQAHVNRGEFNGDPDSLVSYVEESTVDYKGLLDEIIEKNDSSEVESLCEVLSTQKSVRSLGLSDDIDLDQDWELDDILLDDDRFQVPSDVE